MLFRSGLGAATTDEADWAPADLLLAFDPAPTGVAAAALRKWPWLVGWSCRFDLVAHVHGGAARLAADPRLDRVESGSVFDLYRVRPSSACAASASEPSSR